MPDLLDDLRAALATVPDLTDETGALIRSRVEDRAMRMDAELLRALMAVPSLRDAFFAEVDGVAVFDKVRLVQAVSLREFLPDSFTAYGNRIGLSVAGEPLRRVRDVVLDWPYKDCMLVGGMTREDRGADERFVNRIVAPGEVLRLEEPKALTGWERWDAEAVEAGAPKPVEAVTGGENLLIKGNNLFALHSLKERFAGRVKLIYIDPPFNTGDDSFEYNDRFTRSSWLTFMRDRVSVGVSLLDKENGVIVVHVDHGHSHYLKALLDEICHEENLVNIFTITTNEASGFKATGKSIFSTANTIFVYGATSGIVHPHNNAWVPADYDPNYKYVIEDRSKPFDQWVISPIDELVTAAMGLKSTPRKKDANRSAFELQRKLFAETNPDRVFRTASITGGARQKRLSTIRSR